MQNKIPLILNMVLNMGYFSKYISQSFQVILEFHRPQVLKCFTRNETDLIIDQNMQKILF